MKKNIMKILSFVLVLSLMLSATAILGSAIEIEDAAVDGKYLHALKDTTFGEATADEPGTLTFDATENDPGKNDYGILGAGYDEFIHFKWNPDAIDTPANKDDMYYTLSFGKDAIDLANTSYVVFDFEFAGESYITKGFNVGFNAVDEYDLPTNNQKVYFNSLAATLYVDADLAEVDQNSGYAGISSPYNWVHYTVIVDVVYGETYVYGNGEYILKIDGGFDEEAVVATSAFIGFAPGQATVADSFAFDKLQVTSYDLESDVNFWELAEDKDLTLYDDCNDDFYSNLSAAAHVRTPIAKITNQSGETLYYSTYDLGKEAKSGDSVTVLRGITAPLLFVDKTCAEVKGTSGNISVDKNGFGVIYIYFYPGAIATFTRTRYASGSNGYYCNSDITGVKILADTDEVRDTFRKHSDPLVVYTSEFYDNYRTTNVYANYNIGTNSSNGPGYATVTINLNGYEWQQYVPNALDERADKGIGLALTANSTLVMNNGKFTAKEISGNGGAFYFNEMDMSTDTYFNVYNTSVYLYSSQYRGSWVRTVYGVQNGVTINIAFVNCDIVPGSRSGNRAFFNPYNNNANGSKYTMNFYVYDSYLYDVYNQQLCYSISKAERSTGSVKYNFDFKGSELVFTGAFARVDDGNMKINIEDCKVDNNGKGFLYIGAEAGRYDTAATMNVGAENYFSKSIAGFIGGAAGSDLSVAEVNFTSVENNPYLKKVTYGVAPYEYTPAAFTTEEQLLSNLTLYTDFAYNIYIPTNIGLKAVTLNGVHTYTKDMEIDTVGGKDYYRFTNEGISPKAIAEGFTISLSGTLADGSTYGGVKYDFNVLNYAKALISSEYTEAHQLMVDAVAYANEAYKYANAGATNEAITAFLNGKTASTYAPEAEETPAYTADVATYVESAFLNLNSTPKFVFNVKADCTVKLSYVNANGNTISETYDAKAGDQIELTVRVNSLRSNISIEIGEVDGYYNLYTYVTSQAGNECEALVKALHAYSATAEKYTEYLWTISK